MKILQVYPYFYPAWEYGGVTRVVYEMSIHLAARGNEVIVYTTDALNQKSRIKISSYPHYIKGVKTYYFKNLSNYLADKHILALPIEILFREKKEIKNSDVIHLHGGRTLLNIFFYHYAKKHGIPYVLQAHGSLHRIMSKQRLKWVYDMFFGYKLLRDASKVIALSQIEADQYKVMGVPNEKIAIVPNGIDLSDYAYLPSREEFKKKFNISEDKKIILYLGRIHRTKGIDFLLKAFAYLINKMKCKDVLLVVVGPDDGYLHEVKSLSASLGVSNSVLYTGLISDKDKISAYVDSSICSYLNPNEPFGLVPLEALACKTPVIISNGTPMARIVNKGKCGLPVKYGEVNELAQKMNELLISDDLCNELGQNGRKYVLENYNWSSIISQLEKVYAEAIRALESVSKRK